MKSKRNELLETCIKKLKNLGFVNVTIDNIMQDEVYAFHLNRFLLSKLGQSEGLDELIQNLLNSMNKKLNVQ